MTGGDLVSAVPTYLAAVALPFGLCYVLARRGHARTAWWLPGGILAMTALFLAMGLGLRGEVQTGLAAAGSLVAIGLPAAAGGAAGILLGRRRT